MPTPDLNSDAPDALLVACDVVLREIAGYPITSDRLNAALPLLRAILPAIRAMDEVDVSAAEPMTTFRPPV
jgi:hypothetical protein